MFQKGPRRGARQGTRRGPVVSRRAALIGLVAATAATLGIGQGWPADGWPTALGAPLRVRKNAKSLTAAEKERFVGALKALKQKASPWSEDVSVYDEFVRWHSNAFLGDVMPGHLAPAFFPWHRMLNHLFEQELQKVDPTVTIPYWDWATDSSPDAYLWQDDFLGGDGDPSDGFIVKTGPFRQGEWAITIFDVEDSYRVPHLIRAFGTDKRAPELPTAEDDEALLNIQRYDAPPWNDETSPDESVRRYAEDGRGCPRSRSTPQAGPKSVAQIPAQPETQNKIQPAARAGHHGGHGLAEPREGCENGPGMHNRVHLWVGGKFGDPKDPAVGPMSLGVAPNDPVFWLLHANIDRLWVEWQHRHGRVYAPENGGPQGHNVDDAMAPFDSIGLEITPRMMLDHRSLGYVYDTELPLAGPFPARTSRASTPSAPSTAGHTHDDHASAASMAR
jgi:tyrosinase